MALYNPIGRRRCSAVSRKTAFKCFHCFNFSANIRFFVKALIETNVSFSNELNFSDVNRSVNYIWSPAKFTWDSFTLHATQCSLQFDKHQENLIHSLNKAENHVAYFDYFVPVFGQNG